MKRTHIISSLIAILVIFGMTLFESTKNQQAIVNDNNLKNIREVEIGMDTSQVLTIMGSPLYKRTFQGELFYDYEMPSGVSFQCQIIFDSSGSVTFISPDPNRP